MLKQLIVALCAVFLIAGCGSSGSSGGPPPAPPPTQPPPPPPPGPEPEPPPACDIIPGESWSIDVSSQEGVDAWGPSEDTQNLEANFDAEAEALAITPLQWTEGQRWIITNLDEATDLSGATATIEMYVPEAYDGDTLIVQAFAYDDTEGGAGWMSSAWLDLSGDGLNIGNNEITWNIGAAATTNTLGFEIHTHPADLTILEPILVSSYHIQTADIDPCPDAPEPFESFVLEIFENDIQLEVPVLDEDGEPVIGDDDEPETRGLGWDPDNYQDWAGTSELSYDDGALRVGLNLDQVDRNQRNVMYVFDELNEGHLEGYPGPLGNMNGVELVWYMHVPASYQGAGVDIQFYMQQNGDPGYDGNWKGSQGLLSNGDQFELEDLGNNEYRYTMTFASAQPNIQRLGLQLMVGGSIFFGDSPGEDILIREVHVNLPD